jgi:hypothetical protein
MKKYLALDIRALALMRIAIAAVIMYDLAIRLTDLEAFYTDTGAVPLTMLFENAWDDHYVSIHTMSGLWQVQLVLFLISFFFAAMLFIGYRTRLFTILSWFMMLSLHNRNGLILQGGDDLLRMVLFWSIFLPWGARYSIDSLLDYRTGLESQIRTPATVAYVLQLCYLYTGSALLKGPEWNTDYSAMYYAYSLDQIAYPLTKFIYYYPALMKFLTMCAYYFELLVPFLFFIPYKPSFFRLTAIALIILFHFTNGITLLIGLFPLIGIVTVFGLLPSSFMDWMGTKTIKLKVLISESFLGYYSYLRYVFRWKKPAYEFPSVYLNIRNAALIFLIVYVFDWNFSNLSFIDSKLSRDLRFIGYSLRLDQSWGMFAPGVFKDDGWYVHEGITRKNERVDLLNPQRPITYRKPGSVTAMFKNDRWRKYTENYLFPENTFMRGYFCNYCKRVWNETHPDKAVKLLQIIYMGEFTKPLYKYSHPKKEVLCECWEDE